MKFCILFYISYIFRKSLESQSTKNVENDENDRSLIKSPLKFHSPTLSLSSSSSSHDLCNIPKEFRSTLVCSFQLYQIYQIYRQIKKLSNHL